MISKLTLLFLTSLLWKIRFAETDFENMVSPQIDENDDQVPRNLADIKIEVEEKRKVKKIGRKLRLKNGKKAIEEIEDLIKEFNLDAKLDKKDTSDFFKKLENSIYKSMKQTLYKQKSYVKNYSEIVEEYQRLAQDYDKN